MTEAASVQGPQLITTRDDLRAVLPTLRAAPRIALDCESNGMHAYRGVLCVLQLAVARDDRTADEVFIVDTLALGGLGELGEVLGEGGPVKILHDAGFDARLLREVGATLGNVVDTSVFARFLGYKETGLASLLARFDIALQKSLQHHDWALRPLGERELAYLSGDVTDLGRLASSLEAEAAALAIEAEVREETEYGLRNAIADADGGEERPGYARVKGARELGATGRSILREVASVRERAAEAWNLPPGRVIANSALVEIAKVRPRTIAEVRAKGLLRNRAVELEGDFIDAVARGVARGDVPDDERRWFAAERTVGDVGLKRAREALLSHWRAEEAARRSVDLQVVLPGHCVSELTTRGASSLDDLRAVAGFGEVRVARYGEALIALLGSVS